MKILLSPAKSLDFKSELPTSKTSSICFEEEAQYLNSILKSKNPKELSDLMSISLKIADLNYERNHNWSWPFTNKNARQAVYAFSGDVYRGLEAYSIEDSKIGLQSAKAASISTILAPSEFTRGDNFSDADLIVKNLLDPRVKNFLSLS